MDAFIKSQISAPGCQLCEAGTSTTNLVLALAVETLSDKALRSLENDLSFYDQTGFVGVYMSRLLAMLFKDQAPAAA